MKRNDFSIYIALGHGKCVGILEPHTLCFHNSRTGESVEIPHATKATIQNLKEYLDTLANYLPA